MSSSSATYNRPSWRRKSSFEEKEDPHKTPFSSPFFTRNWDDDFQRRSRRMKEEASWRNVEEDSRRITSSMSMTSSEKRTSPPPSNINTNKEDAGGRSAPWRRSQSLHRSSSPNRRRIRFGDEPNNSNSSREDQCMELGQIRDDDECFEVTMDVSTYAPSEITVSAGANRILVVQGKHQDERVSKTFNRKFSLPYNCLLDKIKPTLRTSSQKLVIWVPKSSEEVPLESRPIPLIVKD